MKNRVKRSLIVLLVVAVFTSVFMMSVSAAKSVKLESEQSAAYSRSVTGTWKYVNETTINDASSKQRMRVQFEISPVFSLKNFFAQRPLFDFGWSCEKRIFVNPGEAAPYFETNRYNNKHRFRLALSPEDQKLNGVFGTGTIYN